MKSAGESHVSYLFTSYKFSTSDVLNGVFMHKRQLQMFWNKALRNEPLC